MKSQVEIKRGAYLTRRLIGTLPCLPSIRGPRGLSARTLSQEHLIRLQIGPMTREMLQGEYRPCNMGGAHGGGSLPPQQNPTGGRRLGYRGAVVGRLWIFAGVEPAISHEKTIPSGSDQSAADRLRANSFMVGGPLRAHTCLMTNAQSMTASSHIPVV
jgi:hypothetical protein